MGVKYGIYETERIEQEITTMLESPNKESFVNPHASPNLVVEYMTKRGFKHTIHMQDGHNHIYVLFNNKETNQKAKLIVSVDSGFRKGFTFIKLKEEDAF